MDAASCEQISNLRCAVFRLVAAPFTTLPSRATEVLSSLPANSSGREMGRTKTEEERLPFDRWLLLQSERDGFLRQLAQAVKGDRGFPKHGDAETVRKRLNALGADPDMHEALDDAELGWASY